MKKSSMAGDEGFAKTNRGGDDADLDITPMIDVTFLLLIFFMVTSTMQATQDLDLPPARVGLGADKTKAVEFMVRAPESKGGKPTILIDGRESTLDEVRAAVQDGLRAEKTGVILKADREVPHGFMVELEKAVTEEEGVFLFIGVKDKK